MYRNVSKKQFYSTKWQQKNSITNQNFRHVLLEKGVSQKIVDTIDSNLKNSFMSLKVSPYILSRIDWDNFENCPVRKQFIQFEKVDKSVETQLDSLNENNDTPIDGIVHRYPNKILFLALSQCPVYCTFCTRSYYVGPDTDLVSKTQFQEQYKRWNNGFEYIRCHDEVKDVLISGGDTYMLSPQNLLFLGQNILDIEHVKRLRLATKGLAVMPMKIIDDKEYTKALIHLSNSAHQKGKHFSIQTHFNHPLEITSITSEAMLTLMQNHVTVRNQSVFLKGVNNDTKTMKELIIRLSDIGIIPYYVYMCDLVPNSEIYRTTIQNMLDVEKEIKGLNSGYMTPQFIIDLPNGGGKRGISTFETYQNGKAHYKSFIRKDGMTDFYYLDP